MKKSLIISLLILFSINLITAQYYGDFSIGGFFDSIGEENLMLFATFIISFVILNWVLSKFFVTKQKTAWGGETSESNKSVSTIISLVIALLITYGIHKTGFDINELFFNIGISEDLLYTIIPLLIIAGMGYLFYKFRSKGLITIGILFIIISATELVYSGIFLFIIGIILMIIGFRFYLLRKKKPSPENRPY